MVRLILVVALVLPLAACGGGSDGLSRSQEKELEALVAAAEAAKAQAEAAKAQAELARAQAEADKAAAEAEAQHQLREAERARAAAEAARLAAEAAQQEAERARGEAETAQGQADAAELERQRLAEEAEKAMQAQLQEEASMALPGLATEGLGDPVVNARHQAPASISGPGAVTPAVTFSSPTGGGVGRWYATRAENQGATTDDVIVVYSDVGGPKPTPIDEVYTDEDASTSVFAITIADTHANLIASSSSLFPRGGRTATIPLTIDTDDPKDGTNDATARISGSFRGASGTYQCAHTAACTIRHTGRGYVLGGGIWTFRASQNANVQVADEDFMYFGWWRRKTNATGAYAYRAFHSSVSDPANTVGTGFAALQGTATYRGPAIGQYAVYQPLGTESNHGEFTATAVFTANFDTDMLHGTVSDFDVNSGWSLSLNETSMAGGSVTAGTVSWTIDGDTQAGGAWNGTFHSEINPYAGHIPDGLTGDFDAVYSNVARLRGAYGAHKQ